MLDLVEPETSVRFPIITTGISIVSGIVNGCGVLLLFGVLIQVDGSGCVGLGCGGLGYRVQVVQVELVIARCLRLRCRSSLRSRAEALLLAVPISLCNRIVGYLLPRLRARGRALHALLGGVLPFFNCVAGHR